MDQIETNSCNNETIEVVIHPNKVVESLKKLLQKESSSSSERSIYKVPTNLRSLNPKAYTPQVISIGPYHYGRTDLKATEDYKLSYLRSFLNRINLDVGEAFQKVKRWDKKARNCYAEKIDMNEDDFVKLMLVDGCFIVEYFIRECFPELSPEDDLLPIRLFQGLLCDLMKLENQLPYFVLAGLFELCSDIDPIGTKSFSEITLRNLIPLYETERNFPGVHLSRECHHLVDMLWLLSTPSSPLKMSINGLRAEIFLSLTATELNHACVRFKKSENERIRDIITGITFKNGVLEMPRFYFCTYFETHLRNLIAFEQCHSLDPYISNFTMFMHNLMKTDKDVSLLIKSGIISYHLGSTEVLKLFNNLREHIDVEEFYFNNVYVDMYLYCQTLNHRFIASLRRDYFHAAWSFLTSATALFLLILTVIQTIFTVLSAWK